MLGSYADLRARCMAALANSEQWSAEDVDLLISHAVAFYSNDFPRRFMTVVVPASGAQFFTLSDFFSISAIEHPYDIADPDYASPRFLLRAVYGSEEWLRCNRCYDVVANEEGPTRDSWMRVYLSFKADGLPMRVTGLGVHLAEPNSLDVDKLTVPVEHWEAIVALVVFYAISGLVPDESVDARSSNVSIVLSQLGEAARTAWLRYQDVIDHLRYDASDSIAVDWGSDLVGGRLL